MEKLNENEIAEFQKNVKHWPKALLNSLMGFLFIGILFKIQHWKGAGLFLTISLSGLLIYFIVRGIMIIKFWYSSIPLLGSFIFLFLLVKIQHWSILLEIQEQVFIIFIPGIFLMLIVFYYLEHKKTILDDDILGMNYRSVGLLLLGQFLLFNLFQYILSHYFGLLIANISLGVVLLLMIVLAITLFRKVNVLKKHHVVQFCYQTHVAILELTTAYLVLYIYSIVVLSFMMIV